MVAEPVDRDRSHQQPPGERVAPRHVAAEDVGGQSLLDTVGQRYCIVVVGYPADGGDGAEDFVLGQRAVRADVGQHRRRHEGSGCQFATEPGAAEHHPCGSGRYPVGDHGEDPLRRGVADHGPDLGLGGKGVAHREAFGHRGQLVHYLVVDAGLGQHPVRRGADLSGVLCDRELGYRGDRGVDVGVVEDQHAGLTAQLQQHRGEVGRGGGQNLAAGAGAAGEADLVDTRVGDQRGGALGAGQDDVYHPGRDPGIKAQLAEQNRGVRREFRRLDHHRVAGRQCGSGLHPDLPIGPLNGTIAATTPYGSGSV